MAGPENGPAIFNKSDASVCNVRKIIKFVIIMLSAT